MNSKFFCAAGLSMWLANAVLGAPAISLELVATNFVSPTTLLSEPGTQNLLVADQVGVIYRVKEGGATEPWLDITSKQTNNGAFDERGLLGFALHPEYSSNGRFFIVYSAHKRPTAPPEWDHTWTLSEFKAENSAAKVDSEKKLLEIDQPYFNHNAGCIVFGPDGYLYAAVGDGGAGNDKDDPRLANSKNPGHSPGGNGQDLNNLLGKILRLDVSKPGVMGIPSDNPFVGGKGRPEIYAWGLRNPWRISFDRETKLLYAADIGQELYEEVNIIKKGANYGWPVREGFHCFNQNDGRDTPEECAIVGKDGKPFTDPAFEYKSFRTFRNDPGALGISITGGYIYRGKAIPQLVGKYVFADWSRNMAVADGVLLVATRIGKGASWSLEKLAPKSHPDRLPCIPALGEDSAGELYVLTNDSSQLRGRTGKVWKIVPAPRQP